MFVRAPYPRHMEITGFAINKVILIIMQRVVRTNELWGKGERVLNSH